MPCDLKNQEGLFPGHFDSTYEPGSTPNGQIPGLYERIQDISREMRGVSLSKDKIEKLEAHLESKGLTLRNIGDQELEIEIRSFIKKVSSSMRAINKHARF